MSALNDSEWLALGGLIRSMMHADGKVSLKEHRMVASLAATLGPKLWEALAHAERELDSLAAVKAQARKVTRPGSQKTIRDAVDKMAHADGMAAEEQALLDWLDAAWA